MWTYVRWTVISCFAFRAVSGACAGWCEGKQSTWEGKCTLAGCAACAACAAVPQACSTWCSVDTKAWECGWRGACGGCASCRAIAARAVRTRSRGNSAASVTKRLVPVEAEETPPSSNLHHGVTQLLVLSTHAVGCGWTWAPGQSRHLVEVDLTHCGASHFDSVIFERYASELRTLGYARAWMLLYVPGSSRVTRGRLGGRVTTADGICLWGEGALWRLYPRLEQALQHHRGILRSQPRPQPEL
jgi:hypothetical protein